MTPIEDILHDLSKNIEVLRNRDGQALLKIECAIKNIIETYDGYTKQFVKGADNIEFRYKYNSKKRSRNI